MLISKDYFYSFLPKLTITTTEFFRDPAFFLYLRRTILPVLKTYPRLKIWNAGCSTGEEVYSLAILLTEEGLLERTIIHATDINTQALELAQKGIYDQNKIEDFNKRYVATGGKRSPSAYYTAEYSLFRFNPNLRKNIVFSNHNLTVDTVFIEANLILCRNVLIYFTRKLQDRVLKILSQSLVYRGYLALGTQESLNFSDVAALFDPVDSQRGLYQLKTQPSYTGIA